MIIDDDKLKLAINNSSEQLLQLSKDIKNVSFPQSEILELDTNKLNDVYICDLLKDIPAGYSKDLKDTDQ